jgi:AraC family transcriptional regulator
MASESLPRPEEGIMASLLQPAAPIFASASCPPPEPILSSQSRHWDGCVVELYRVREVDFVKQDSAHTVAVFLRGPVNLEQRRYGRVYQRIMRAGDVIVAPAGEPRALRHKEETELVKLRLAPSLFAGIIEDSMVNGSSRIELLDNFGGRDIHIEDLARRLIGEVRADALASRLYAESLATQLAVHLVRHYSTASKLTNGGSNKLSRYKLQRVTDYINDNLREDLALGKIAAILSMSRYHFAHAFRQTTGLAPHRYVIQRRIEYAKRLLRETDLTVAEVARQVGYANQSNFCVAFHRFTGQTPGSFRNAA